MPRTAAHYAQQASAHQTDDDTTRTCMDDLLTLHAVLQRVSSRRAQHHPLPRVLPFPRGYQSAKDALKDAEYYLHLASEALRHADRGGPDGVM